jgi:2-iminobutanoate/2-iminopropanoate deaminase
MPRPFNPDGVPQPVGLYSQAILHDLGGGGRRLVISGQIGVRLDGSIAEGLEAQMEVAWDNFLAVVRAAGMSYDNIVKVTTFAAARDSIEAARAVRRRKLPDHRPASTYLEVAGLASPDYLFEIEGEAVEDPA